MKGDLQIMTVRKNIHWIWKYICRNFKKWQCYLIHERKKMQCNALCFLWVVKNATWFWKWEKVFAWNKIMCTGYPRKDSLKLKWRNSKAGRIESNKWNVEPVNFTCHDSQKHLAITAINNLMPKVVTVGIKTSFRERVVILSRFFFRRVKEN